MPSNISRPRATSNGQLIYPLLEVADRISVAADGHTIQELAAIAAEWFQFHWDAFLPQRDRLKAEGR